MQQRDLAAPAIAEIDGAELAVARHQRAGEFVGGAGEIGDEQIGRPVIDFVGRAHLQQLAVAHHADAVAEHDRFGLVVGDVERGHAGLLEDAAQIVAQPQAQLGVEIRQRLVEQQQLRPVDDAARQRHALHLPARQRHHRTVGIFGQADQRQHLVDLAAGLRARDLAMLQRIDHVLPHRHMRPHRIGLEHHAEVAQPRRHQNAARGRRHDIAADRNLAAGRMLEPGDAAQRRGLAAAGRPEQHDDLACRHGKADAVDRGPADRKLLAQVGDFERRRHASVRFMRRSFTADTRTSCPTPRPTAPCSFTYSSNFGNQTLTTLGSKPSG